MTSNPQKTCFVTIGATASFDALIKAVLSPSFCTALEAQNYTALLVQYGQGGEPIYEQCLENLKAAQDIKLSVSGFDIDMDGLGRYMRQAKGLGYQNAVEGVVFSHAGQSLPTLYIQ